MITRIEAIIQMWEHGRISRADMLHQLFELIKTKTMKEYTVEQWFSLLPPDIRQKAIAYTSVWRFERKEPTFHDALSGSFLWHESIEGFEYWAEIAMKDWGTPQDETVQDNTPEPDNTESQNKQILAHLEAGLPITPLEALKRYGCFRLGARIHDLRAKGHPIATTMVSDGRKRYATYSINSK